MLNQPKFLLSLEHHLPKIPQIETPTPVTIEVYTRAIGKAMSKAIDDSTPWKRPSPWAKSYFTQECKEAIHTKQQCRHRIDRLRKSGQTVPDNIIMQFTSARKQAKSLIRKTIRREHQDKVTKATENMQSVWKLVRWASNRDTSFQVYTPPIQGPNGLEFEPKSKAEIMANAFFPIPPPANLINLASSVYMKHEQTPSITREEITSSVIKMAKGKAAGPDDIPSEVLQAGLSLLLDHLD